LVAPEVVTLLLKLLAALWLVATAATTAAPTPAPTALPTPVLAPTPTDWSLNLYNSDGVRYQNPDGEACTAATVETALNLASLDGQQPPYWSPSTSYATEEELFRYERAHMTMPSDVPGSDPHGVRNALNYFGWGSMVAGVYTDVAPSAFGAAAKAIVSSIARTRKPAIVFVMAGGHTQLVTGYTVHGSNPATSDSFTIVGIYLTDPLLGFLSLTGGNGVTQTFAAVHMNSWVSLRDWRYGPVAVRFSEYWQKDSWMRDPIDGKVGRNEWYGRFVAVIATR